MQEMSGRGLGSQAADPLSCCDHDLHDYCNASTTCLPWPAYGRLRQMCEACRGCSKPRSFSMQGFCTHHRRSSSRSRRHRGRTRSRRPAWHTSSRPRHLPPPRPGTPTRGSGRSRGVGAPRGGTPWSLNRTRRPSTSSASMRAPAQRLSTRWPTRRCCLRCHRTRSEIEWLTAQLHAHLS